MNASLDARAYEAFEDAQSSSESTRDIAVLLHKKASDRGLTPSQSLGLLPSHQLLEPEVGRAMDFATPGGFRRQYVLAERGTERGRRGTVEFYSAFISSLVSSLDDHTAADAKEEGTLGMGETTVAILKAFVGSAVLFLPKGFENGGLIMSNFTLAFMAILCTFCVCRLITCSHLMEGHGRRNASYGEIAAFSLGPLGARAVNCSLVLSQLGFCCGYLIFIASNIHDVASSFSPTSGATLSFETLFLIQIPIFAALACVRRLAYFVYTSLIADGCILFGLIAIFGCAVSERFSVPTPPELHLMNDRLPLFLGTAAFTFEGIGLVLPILSSMQPHLRPKLPWLLSGIILGVLSMECLFASVVYSAYGSQVQIIVTANLPPGMIVLVQIAYSIALLFSFPLMLYPVISIIESRTLPESSKRNASMKVKKNMLRTSLVLTTALVAWAGRDKLDNFVALVGGFCSAPLALIYPVAMHTCLTRKKTPRGFQLSPSSVSRGAPQVGSSPFGLTINVVVGLLGLLISIFATGFAIYTWPSSR